MSDERVLIINTGGTIGMIHSEPDNPLSPLVPATSFDEIAGNHPILRPDLLGVQTEYYQFPRLIDSSDIQYENWQQMAQVISDYYERCSGFVILHGTDTMCYTAAALSFMLENLDKPVILTGSQRPMVEARSDAVQNFVTSIQIAAPKKFGYPQIPEVCIFFRDKLIRGNRSRKVSSSGYAGFESPNYPELAIAGEHVTFKREFIRTVPPNSPEFFASTYLDTHVMVIEIFPGFDPQILRNIFSKPTSEDQRIKGLILKTYGAGNAPSNREFLSAIEYVSSQGTIIVDVTQCVQGMVELGLYEASSGLLNRGVISGLDLTPEAAVSKLMYLLGKGWSKEEIKRVMQLNLMGEQSLNIYNIDFEGSGKADSVYKASQTVPGDIDFGRFEGAALRFQDAKFLKGQEEGTPIELRIFLNHPGADATSSATDPRCAGTVRREMRGERTVDLFCDVSAASKRLIRPGQPTSISVVAQPGQSVEWEKVGLSIYTKAG